jgi:hypothetical protein
MWVVFSHCGYPPLTEGLDRGNPLALLVQGVYGNLFAGVPAVIVFFVISGFCIHHPFRAPGSFQLLPYLTRRYVRIGIPLVAAVLRRTSGGREAHLVSKLRALESSRGTDLLHHLSRAAETACTCGVELDHRRLLRSGVWRHCLFPIGDGLQPLWSTFGFRGGLPLLAAGLQTGGTGRTGAGCDGEKGLPLVVVLAFDRLGAQLDVQRVAFSFS